jgi:hypothetical protein
MEMSKKIVLLALAGVMVFSVSAFAYGGPGMGFLAGNWGDSAQCFGPGMMWSGIDGDRGTPRQGGWHRDHRSGKLRQGADERVQLPAEITDKMTVLQRTHLEMRLALTEEKPDVARARELFEKSQEIRNEVARWHFERALENFQKTE